MKKSILRFAIVMGTLLSVSSVALAQYVWLDEKGFKQFSDQPPPASVPKNKILKFPGRTIDNSGDDADTDQIKAAKPPETVAEKEAAFKKRRDEMAAKAKKAEEQEKNAAAKADNCRRMREYKQSLDSGQRIAQFDANGNRTMMSDEKRNQELSSMSQSLSDCTN